ncbi:hypothetical protein [Ruminococcus sp. HUN007]|uniref:hypothetical protein n=1 Tax=Ruminococcus sp. HUN007 TaxID=1514668 RepID=UPI0012DC4F22|nr:hypothetical protein [Ruminococcus sp. HUN007]
MIGCAFYGFSMGAFNTFEFVRIYSLATMISVLYLYYHAKLYHSDKIKKNMIIIFFITLTGCLTHHFFVPFAGCVSVCFCIYYLIRKRYKSFFAYSFTMVGSVAASVILFPATIAHFFSDQTQDAKYPFIWQFKLTLNCMLKELFGVSVSVMKMHSYTADLIVAACICVLIIPLLFLFRKEVWFRNFISFLKKYFLKAVAKIKNTDLMIISILVSVFGMILLTALTVSYIFMEKQTDRYIFIVFPGAIAAFTVIINSIFKCIKKQAVANFILAVLCTVFCVMSNLYGPDNYIFTKEDGAVSVQKTIKDSDCVFISDDFWLLTCFTRLSMESDYLYAITGENLKNDIADISDPPSDDSDLYYFVDENSLYVEYDTESMKWPVRGMGKDQSEKLTKTQLESELYEKYSMCEYIGFDNVFRRKFLIYKVK